MGASPGPAAASSPPLVALRLAASFHFWLRCIVHRSVQAGCNQSANIALFISFDPRHGCIGDWVWLAQPVRVSASGA